MAVFVGRVGVISIPAAFAVMATAETLALGGILLVKLRRRMRAGSPEGPAIKAGARIAEG